LTAGVAVTLCLAAPSPAAAQRLIISYSPSPGAPSVTQSIDLDTLSTEWTEPGVVSAVPVFTADGRHVLYRRAVTAAGPQVLFLRDVLAGAAISLPFDFEPRLAHPSQVAIFGLADVHSTGFGTSAGTLARLDASGLHTGGGCATGTTVELDLSTDGERVAALCQSGDVVVVDASSGQLLRTLTADLATPVMSMRVNHDGTQLLVIRRSGATNEIAVVDVASGTTVATRATSPAGAGCVFAGTAPDKTMAVVGCTSVSLPSIIGNAYILDVGTLTPGPPLASLIPGKAVFSPDNRDVFLSSRHRLGFGGLSRHDVVTGVQTLSSGVISPGHFAVAFAPLAPALTVAVAARRVDLSWTLPIHSPVATRYLLEVGTLPGSSDIGTIPAEGPGLTVPAAPPGRYVVRVRAVNATGTGAASNEVVVDVP
jgi:hypothetical protein